VGVISAVAALPEAGDKGEGRYVMIVSEAEKSAIESAIAKAERFTSGEIVAVITRASGGYHAFSLLYAALAALALPWPLIYWTSEPLPAIYAEQLALFAILAILLHFPPIRFALVPPSVKRETAHRRGVEQFLVQNLHTKPGHTGVLLFVSVAEHYVEIFADAAVHSLVPAAEWHAIAGSLATDIGGGAAGAGLERAVTRIGEHLAQHFPPNPRQENVLPNHLIMLSG
jgi:putative membrane protein